MDKPNKDKIVLQDTQVWHKIKTETFNRNSIWYTNRPISLRTQWDNKYLDFVAVSWSVNVLWDATPWINYTWDTTKIIPFSSILDSWWKYPREFTSDWGLIIPADWTYILDLTLIFAMISNTDSKTAADIRAEYWNVALLSFVSQAASDWATKDFVYYETKRFDLTVDCANFWFSWNLWKWMVLYCHAAHRWDWITFPVINTLYVTKIS